jgi:ribosome-associated protein
VSDEVTRLGQFLKLMDAVDTGGEAKMRIAAGDVLVNGEVELRRGRQLQTGDIVTIDGKRYEVI